jgi:hypothetical protein
MLRIAIYSALCAIATATHAGTLRGQAGGFVRALEFNHRLRVCNAYPYNAALDIFRGVTEKLTSDAPMHYRTCKDFKAPLRSGDKLEFKVGDANTGTFAVGDLPQNDAVLLLVIGRHDTLSTAVSFESHVYANLHNAEVVVMDTYKGKRKSTVNIKDMAKPKIQGTSLRQKTPEEERQSRSEALRYDSVVAIQPGDYEVELIDANGLATATTPFVAQAAESYVILRTGVEAQQGPAYTEELLIYPNSLHGGAAFAKASVVALIVFLGFAQWL